MGYALAEAALRRGARVLLVSGPTRSLRPAAAEITRVESAEQMRDAVLNLLPQATIVIKTAAVSRLPCPRPRLAEDQAKGSDDARTGADARHPEGISQKKGTQILVGFAAETENVLENARQKLVSKNLDAIVVNDVSREGVGFDSDRNAVTIITRDEVVEVPETTKWEVAQRVLDQVVRLRQPRNSSSQGLRRAVRDPSASPCERQSIIALSLPCNDSRSRTASRSGWSEFATTANSAFTISTREPTNASATSVLQNRSWANPQAEYQRKCPRKSAVVAKPVEPDPSPS